MKFFDGLFNSLADRIFEKVEQRKYSKTENLPEDIFYVYPASTGFGLSESNMGNIARYSSAFRGLSYRCLHLRSDAIADAMSKLSVERKTKQLEYKEVEATHPWVTLLRSPSDVISSVELWKWISLACDMKGHAELFVYRDAYGIPISLLPVYSVFGSVVPKPDIYGGIESYIFYSASGEKYNVPVENVIRFKHLNPESPYATASLIQAAAYQIDIDLYTKIYRRDSLRKGGVNSLALVSDQELSEPQVELYGKKFKEKVFGMEKIGEVPVMGKGLKPYNFAISAKDLEFIQGVKVNDTEALQIFGVPEGMVSDKSNRANAREARLVFYQNTIQPQVLIYAHQMTSCFEKIFQSDRGVLEIRVPDLLPTDHDFELRKNIEYVKSGIYTRNEVRSEDGRKEIPNGDEIIINTNSMFLSQLHNTKEKK